MSQVIKSVAEISKDTGHVGAEGGINVGGINVGHHMMHKYVNHS